MKKDNLENRFKKSIDSYNPVLNHDEIWDNIEPQLKKKKKRIFLFFWLFGGALILGTLLRQATINSDANAVVQNMEVEAPTNLNPSTHQINSTRENDETSFRNQISSNNQSDESILGLNKRKDVPTVSTKRDIQLAVNMTEINPIQGLNNVKYYEPANQDGQIISSSSQMSTDGIYIQNEARNQEQKNTKAVNQLDNRNEDIRNETPLSNTAKKNISDLIENLAKIERDKESAEKDARNKSKKVKVRSKKLKSKKEKSKKNKSKKVKNPKEEKDKPTKKITTRSPRKKAKYFAQPTLSLVAPVRNLSLRNPWDDARILNQRKETETQLESFGIGFNIYRQSRNGLIIVAGVEYLRFNFRTGFERFEEETEVIQGIISTTENAQGDIIKQEIGPKVISRTTIEEERFFNHHTFVNFLIGVGKVWENRKYDFKLLGGFDLNLYHNFKGVIKNGILNINTNRPSSKDFEKVFKRRTGLGIWVSSEFAKPINDKTLLFVAPRVQIPFSKITVDEYLIKQRYFNFYLTVGASIKLN